MFLGSAPQQQFIPNGQFLPANHFPQNPPSQQFNQVPHQQIPQQGQQQQREQSTLVPGPLPQQRPSVNIEGKPKTLHSFF